MPDFTLTVLQHQSQYLLPLRMRTAGICPQSTSMVFVVRSLLQQEYAFIIENKYRKCPMQFPLNMGIQLFHFTQWNIVFIDQYDFISFQFSALFVNNLFYGFRIDFQHPFSCKSVFNYGFWIIVCSKFG